MKCQLVTWNENTVVDTRIFMQQIKALKWDFLRIVSGSVPENEVKEYVDDLLEIAIEFDHLPNQLFWAMDHPYEMPADARVDFLYTPTYLAVGIITYAYQYYESVRNTDNIENYIRYALSACMGRHFHGHGYGAYDGFLDTMLIFTACQMSRFIRNYPEIAPDFCKMFEDALPKWNEEYGSLATVKRNSSDAFDPINIFVYGTLKRGEKAYSLLTGAKYICSGELRDYALYDLGNFPAIRPNQGTLVHGEVYAVSPELLSELDHYENEGSLYTRTDTTVHTHDGCVKAQVYVYLLPIKDKKCEENWHGKIIDALDFEAE